MSSDEELELIKQQKLLQLQQQLAERERQEALRREIEIRKQNILRQILTPEARSRLTNIKMVKPEFAEQLEAYLIQAAQAGRIKEPITDQQLKRLLEILISRTRRETRIIRK